MWYETWSLPSFLLLGSFFTSNPTPARISARESSQPSRCRRGTCSLSASKPTL